MNTKKNAYQFKSHKKLIVKFKMKKKRITKKEYVF